MLVVPQAQNAVDVSPTGSSYRIDSRTPPFRACSAMHTLLSIVQPAALWLDENALICMHALAFAFLEAVDMLSANSSRWHHRDYSFLLRCVVVSCFPRTTCVCRNRDVHLRRSMLYLHLLIALSLFGACLQRLQARTMRAAQLRSHRKCWCALPSMCALCIIPFNYVWFHLIWFGF